MLRETGAPELSRIVLSSSKTSITEIVYGILRGFGKTDLVHYHAALPVSFRYTNPSGLGADRIADLLYGNSAYPGLNLIIIDAGTAITINVMKKQEFMGGAILPGVETQLKSLYTSTDALPMVNIRDSAPIPVLGNGTTTCINAGVVHGIAGSLNHLVHCYKRIISGENITILATGGSWPILSNLVAFDSITIPDLTLVGAGLFFPPP